MSESLQKARELLINEMNKSGDSYVLAVGVLVETGERFATFQKSQGFARGFGEIVCEQKVKLDYLDYHWSPMSMWREFVKEGVPITYSETKDLVRDFLRELVKLAEKDAKIASVYDQLVEEILPTVPELKQKDWSTKVASDIEDKLNKTKVKYE